MSEQKTLLPEQERKLRWLIANYCDSYCANEPAVEDEYYWSGNGNCGQSFQAIRDFILQALETEMRKVERAKEFAKWMSDEGHIVMSSACSGGQMCQCGVTKARKLLKELEE